MKKLLRMICLTLALCMLAGCGTGGAQPTPSGAFRQTGETVEPATAQELAACQLAAADYPDYPQRPGMEDYTDSQGSMDMDAYDAAMRAYQEALAKLGKLSAKPDIPAVRDFAADTSLRLLAGETENAVYSPVSLYLTLAMLADLSGGDTSQQVRQLLNLQDPEALRQQVQQLWMALYCDNGITTCRLAGSAWVAQGSTVHQAALDSLAGVHRCGVYQAAMGTQEANRAIAAWAGPADRRPAPGRYRLHPDQSHGAAAAVQHRVLQGRLAPGVRKGGYISPEVPPGLRQRGDGGLHAPGG